MLWKIKNKSLSHIFSRITETTWSYASQEDQLEMNYILCEWIVVHTMGHTEGREHIKAFTSNLLKYCFNCFSKFWVCLINFPLIWSIFRILFRDQILQKQLITRLLHWMQNNDANKCAKLNAAVAPEQILCCNNTIFKIPKNYNGVWKH